MQAETLASRATRKFGGFKAQTLAHNGVLFPEPAALSYPRHLGGVQVVGRAVQADGRVAIGQPIPQVQREMGR